MATTVHPTPDTTSPSQHEHLVDRIVAQLRGAGVETSDQAVRVLAIHAHRRQLDTGDLVEILSRFEVGRRWPAYVRRRAAQLLADVGTAAGYEAVNVLELDVATARGFAEYASLDGHAPGERPGADQPRPEVTPDLDMARDELIGTIDGILNASNPAMSDSDQVARIREAYERYRARQRSTGLASCSTPATVVVEGYTPVGGRAHGSLDRAYYACAAHVGHIELLVRALGMTSYRTSGSVPADVRRCGDVWDYTTLRQVDRPERERLRLCAVCGELVELVTEGPDPYWWRHVGVIGGPPHAGEPGPVM